MELLFARGLHFRSALGVQNFELERVTASQRHERKTCSNNNPDQKKRIIFHRQSSQLKWYAQKKAL